jgi:hypothetical protein
MLSFTESLFASARHVTNEANILVGLVLPNPKIRSYFVERGMPPALAAAGNGMTSQDLGQADIATMTDDRRILHDIAPDFIPKVDPIYTRYLLSHPNYLIENTVKYRDIIFGQNWISSTVEDHPNFTKPGTPVPVTVADSIDISAMDYIPIYVCIAAFGAQIVQALVRAGRACHVIPAFVLAVGFSNAVLGFFGDLWERSEMTRHAFIGSVLLRIGLVLAVLFLLDGLMRYFPRRSDAPRVSGGDASRE